MEAKGRNQIRADRADRARKLLAAGWPQRQVALQTGLGRRTVQRIAAGEHRADEAATPAQRCECGAKITTDYCVRCGAQQARDRMPRAQKPAAKPIRRCLRCGKATTDYYFAAPETGRRTLDETGQPGAICAACFEDGLRRDARVNVAPKPSVDRPAKVLDKTLFAKRRVDAGNSERGARSAEPR